MNHAVLSLGSNVGDRLHHLKSAKQELEKHGCRMLQQSSVYETEPWGNKNQSSFYNEVIEIETMHAASQLMHLILGIEKSLGRIRTEKWQPRTIDIDILFFNNEIIHEEHLTIPHPHLHERNFVLKPLNEILPQFMHPFLKKNISELFSQLADTSEVKKI
jgi:2-amino-4-hydroxy-6-hydroxymethyldihydropteridine diphosphokinase